MSTSNAIFGPVFALAAWTLIVLIRVAVARLLAVGRRQLSPGDFRLGESAAVASSVSLPNRNYMNLLELPVLFYVACIVAYVTASASGLVVAMAWLYVLLRVVHTLIHLGYNNVVHRLVVFAASNFVLTGLLVAVGAAVFGKSSS